MQPGGEHAPLTGPMHDQKVRAVGLPDLPGARQELAGRLQCHEGTSSRFAPARRPDLVEA